MKCNANVGSMLEQTTQLSYDQHLSSVSRIVSGLDSTIADPSHCIRRFSINGDVICQHNLMTEVTINP
jgi:hypothetical protein